MPMNMLCKFTKLKTVKDIEIEQEVKVLDAYTNFLSMATKAHQ